MSGVLPASTVVLTITPPDGIHVRHCHATLLQSLSPLIDAPPQQWLLTAAHCFGYGRDQFGQKTAFPPLSGGAVYSIAAADGRGNGASWTLSATSRTRIYFHPLARPEEDDTGWTQEFDGNATNCGHDRALVRLPAPLEGVQPAVLWHDGCTADQLAQGCVEDLSNYAATFGGWDGEFDGVNLTYATGHIAKGKVGLERCTDNGWPAIKTASATYPTGGDSGAGLFIDTNVPAIPYGDLCDSVPTLFNPTTRPQPVLVGVLKGLDGSKGLFSPVYLPEWAAAEDGDPMPNDVWLHDMFRNGLDHDGICDEVDNCPDTDNYDQADSNHLAEETWGGANPATGSLEVGDKCDPAPTPVVGLSGPAIVALQNTRAVDDQITVHPVIEPGDSVKSQAHALFCLCRNPDGTPITDRTKCANPPWNCDPQGYYDVRATPGNSYFTEVATPQGTTSLKNTTFTTWHLISASEPGTPVLFPPYPLPADYDHPFQMTYPGPDHTATWRYQADNDYWNLEGYFDNQPPSPAPDYPPGTDLGGVLWMHDSTPAGADQHGLPGVTTCLPGSGCTAGNVADSYDFGVAPDRRVAGAAHFHQHDSVYTYFAGGAAAQGQHFAGEDLIHPPPIVEIDPATGSSLYWLSGGRRFPADDILSATLRQQLADPSLRWVPASEPVSVTQFADLPRAAALSSDGSELVGFVVETDTGFQSSTEGIIGGGGGNLGAPAPAAAQPATPGRTLRDAMLAHADGPTPRADFAATWSRINGELSVAGGHDAAGQPVSDVWTLRAAGWDQRQLFGGPTPADVESATYAWKDSRIWLVDDVSPASPGARARRVLYRIQPTSGWIDGTWTIGTLGSADHVWLSAAADGRVVLTAAGKDRWLLALVSSHRCGEPGPNPRNLHGAGAGRSEQHGCRHARLSVDGFARGRGRLAAPPQILYGHITGAFVKQAPGGSVLDVRFIADLAELHHEPCELDADLH